MKTTLLIFSLILVISLFMVATTQVSGSTSTASDDSRSGDEWSAGKPTKKPNDHAADASGKDKDKGKPVNIKGIIASSDAASLVVNQDNGSPVTVLITADTRIKGGIASLLPGLQVGVQATEKDGVLTARSIHVIPGKPAKTHNVGVVTDYQPGVSITIACKDGLSYTFLLAADAKILPEERVSLLIVGAYVTVISPRDVTTTDLIATGIVVHPAVPPGQHITPQATIEITPQS